MIASAGMAILVSVLWPQGFSLSLASGLIRNTQLRGFLIFLGALVLLMRFKMNPIYVMLLSGGAEVAWQMGLRLISGGM